jgi:hypothetical protein
MGGTNVRGRNDYYPEYDAGQDAGGLLDLLHALMQQGQAGPGVNSGSTSNGSNNDDTPQGGLLGRFLAMMGPNQVEPGNANSQLRGNIGPTPPTRITVRPFDANYPADPADPGTDRGNALQESPDSVPALSGPRNPNFRQLSRISAQPQGPDGPSGRRDNQPGPPYPVFGDASLTLPSRSAQSGQAPQSGRSLSDRFQELWDHPPSYGAVSALKQALNGIALAVQGSIDATNAPSTEEEAFRQNLGRERGPVGAWQAASLLAPTAGVSASRILASPLVEAVANHLPSLPAAERILGRGIDSPTVTRVPSARMVSAPNFYSEVQNPTALANRLFAPASVLSANSTRAPLQPSGRLFSAYAGRPLLPWFAAALAMKTAADGLQGSKTPGDPVGPVAMPAFPVPNFAALLGGATILNQKKRPAPGSRKGGDRKSDDDDDDDDPVIDPTEWLKDYRRGVEARALERGKAVGRNSAAGNGPGDYCSNRKLEEEKNCYKRIPDYAHWHFLQACKDRTTERMAKCYKGDLNPEGLDEWGLNEEEISRNGWLEGLLESLKSQK